MSLWPSSFPSLFFPEIGHKTPRWKAPILCWLERSIFITWDRECRAKKIVYVFFKSAKLTFIFLVIPLPLTTPTLNPLVLSILHKCTFFFSERYKSFFLCLPLQVFILLWRLPCTCKNSVKFICFFLCSSVLVSLIFRPSQVHEEFWGKRFPSLHDH